MRIDSSKGQKEGWEPHSYLSRVFQSENRASLKPLKEDYIGPTGGTQRGQCSWSKMSGTG